MKVICILLVAAAFLMIGSEAATASSFRTTQVDRMASASNELLDFHQDVMNLNVYQVDTDIEYGFIGDGEAYDLIKPLSKKWEIWNASVESMWQLANRSYARAGKVADQAISQGNRKQCSKGRKALRSAKSKRAISKSSWATMVSLYKGTVAKRAALTERLRELDALNETGPTKSDGTHIDGAIYQFGSDEIRSFDMTDPNAELLLSTIYDEFLFLPDSYEQIDYDLIKLFGSNYVPSATQAKALAKKALSRCR